jgi:hypothetical protein
MLDELNSEEVQMYKRLDRFLHLSWNYSPFWRAVRGILCSSPLLIAGIWLIVLIFKDKGMNAAAVGVLSVMALASLASCAGIIIALQKVRAADFEHIKALILADSIGTIHNDLMTVQKLKGTPFHAGSRYLFCKGQNFCRISDISGVVITREEEGDNVYTAALTFKDEFGGGIMKIRNLHSMTENARESELKKIRETICRITSDPDYKTV